MALTFNHATHRVGIPQADAQPLLIQGLINAIRDEEASERGIVEPHIADASGKADLGGGVQTGITVALRDDWMLSFAAGAYQAAVTGGNLADGLARIANTGSPQVLINSSAAATVVSGSGGGSGGATPAQIWQHTIEGMTAEQVMRIALAALAGKSVGIGTATEQYMAQDGTTPRIAAEFDAQGNRINVTLDGS